MQLTDHTLTIGGHTETIPTLAVDATVHAWSVPTTYRESGYYISVQQLGDPMDVPACDGRDVQYLGALALEADEGAKAAKVEEDLATAKAAACATIDARAEALRLTVLTPGAGQMAAYQAKEAQAAAFLQDGTPTEVEYPDIFNEIGITADSAAEVAAAILAAAEKWRLFGRVVERTRLAGKKAVQAAADMAGIMAAQESVEWPEAG